MTATINRHYRLFLMALLVILISACAAGDPRFSQDTPAGFWWGIWHGIISVVSLIVHVFNENVLVYERYNSGGWYDLGFLIGAICVWGGGSHVKKKSAERKRREKEWEDVGEKVEKKVMIKLKQWAEEDEPSEGDKEWAEIGEKVETKLKRKIREWAEKE